MKQNALHDTDPVVGRLSRFLKTQVLFLDRAQIGGMHRGVGVEGQQLLRVEGTLTGVSRTKAARIKSKLYARCRKTLSSLFGMDYFSCFNEYFISVLELKNLNMISDQLLKQSPAVFNLRGLVKELVQSCIHKKHHKDEFMKCLSAVGTAGTEQAEFEDFWLMRSDSHKADK